MYGFIKVVCQYIHMTSHAFSAKSSSSYSLNYLNRGEISVDEVPLLLRELVGPEFTSYILNELRVSNRLHLFYGTVIYWYSNLQASGSHMASVMRGIIAIFMADYMDLGVLQQFLEISLEKELDQIHHSV